MFEIANKLGCRVLTKLVELDRDVHPYLSTLMVAALVLVRQVLATYLPKHCMSARAQKPTADSMGTNS